ncbi:ABC transporter permease [Nocardia asteroides]|uniref:ABC transporter permease protein n=1 Tax=Nocardia asteroides NBRC 15531 TaxID=1110697 RepID=U5EHW2_NOCAS|nr:ABC transporter permease [Nocardia asteroides]TLF62168.1 ABC transporter permease [Nocardia asteroides NBRC 15531]UGT48239.1 ABC transporter permease [Nocardia asteroides]SFN73376.1 oligopeptide transport system permease protein [Nocardia asteroides]VEG32682.1 Dipeptide transport system permease protein dppB [Nocardia asteroides]GAD84724.1 putative ABC transporter permease protein [Nocardia asteroides NBRC 15531]
MAWYILRRLLQMIPVFLGATLLIYAMVFLIPGDPIKALAGEKPLTPAAEAALRARYHLDQPFIVQYLHYLKGILTLDFGTSFSGRPVREELARAFPITIRLAFLAVLIEGFFGIVFGLIAGLRKGKLFDSTMLIASLVIIALPVFVVGYLAQYFLGVKWGIAPVTVTGKASLGELLVPAFVLGSLSFAYVLRLTRNSVAENKSADYVRTATAKGLGRKRVVTVHILRNSMIPVVTFLGADFGALMAGAIVTEGIFNIPGVGGTMYQAIIRGEPPTVVSFVTVLVVIFLVMNLLIDLLYAALDPRIRYA